MKKQILNSIVVVTFLGLCAIVPVNGQVHSRLKVNVPFDFNVNGKRFFAGEYVIASINPASGQTALAFQRVADKSSQLVFLLPMNLRGNRNDSSGVLTFNRYGSTYFLAEIRNASENFGAQAQKSREEKSLAKQTGESKRETVALNPIKR